MEVDSVQGTRSVEPVEVPLCDNDQAAIRVRIERIRDELADAEIAWAAALTDDKAKLEAKSEEAVASFGKLRIEHAALVEDSKKLSLQLGYWESNARRYAQMAQTAGLLDGYTASTAAGASVKPLLREWLQHNYPTIYEFQNDTGWAVLPPKLKSKFSKYEAHCLRIRANAAHIVHMDTGTERTELECKTLVSANWLLETGEYFPEDLLAFKADLKNGRYPFIAR